MVLKIAKEQAETVAARGPNSWRGPSNWTSERGQVATVQARPELESSLRSPSKAWQSTPGRVQALLQALPEVLWRQRLNLLQRLAWLPEWARRY